MKLLKYELIKLRGARFVLIFFAAMLVLNIVLAWNTASKSQENALVTDNDAAAAYFEAFAERERSIRNAEARGDDKFRPTSLDELPTGDVPVIRLRALLSKFQTDVNSYASDVDRVIDAANTNLAEYKEGTYNHRYQTRVISLYENVKDKVMFGIEYPHGWGEYFGYDAVNVFILAVVLTSSAVIFTSESASGILPVIKATRRGRRSTACAKIAASFIVSVTATAIFTLSTLAVFAVSLGLSSPYNAIQIFSSFRMSQYAISVGAYFAISLAVRTAAVFVFSLAVLFVSSLARNYLVTYIVGLGVVGVNFFVYNMRVTTSDFALRYLNLIAVTDADPLFERFRAVNLFGFPVGYVPFASVVLAFLAVLFAVLFAETYSRLSPTSAPPRIGRRRAAKAGEAS